MKHIIAVLRTAGLGDLKEPPSLGESSHVTSSQIARYHSPTILHIFRTAAKRIKHVSDPKFMHRAVKDTKICSVPRIFKVIVNCSCVQKENTKQEDIFQLIDPETKQRKQSFEFFDLKTCQLNQFGIQVFDEIYNVKC